MENLTNISVENQAAATTKSSAKPLRKAKNARSTKKALIDKVASQGEEPTTAEQAAPVAEAPATEPQAQAAPAEQQKLIVAKKISNGRWYVYFKGVRPEDNVGCGCKTAKSAIRYMLMIKRKFSAKIDEAIYAMLNAEAQAEAL